MKGKYEERVKEDGEIRSCESCHCEVPTAIFHGDEFLCFYCANIHGRPDHGITKAQFCQGLNLLTEQMDEMRSL